MRLWSKLLIGVALFILAERFSHRCTDGFETVRVLRASSFPPSNPNPQELGTLKAVFSQRFYFLSSGKHSYAFISEDGAFVLKLFKAELPFKQKRKQSALASASLAYQALQEETGLLYFSPNPGESFKDISVRVVDKIGIQHNLKLRGTPFTLQWRADNPYEVLSLHIKHQDSEAAQKVIREIVACLKAYHDKQLRSARPTIGLIKDRAVLTSIDTFSELSLTPEEKQDALHRDTRHLRKWIEERSPELAAYLNSITF